MLIEETRDARRVNAIANDPRIFESVACGRAYPIDTAPAVERAVNVTFVGAYGAFIFARCVPGVYEVHAAVLPEGRGDWTREAGRAAIGEMFENHGCEAIVFPCPKRNHEAAFAALMFGATRLAERDGFVFYVLRRPERSN